MIEMLARELESPAQSLLQSESGLDAFMEVQVQSGCLLVLLVSSRARPSVMAHYRTLRFPRDAADVSLTSSGGYRHSI